MPETSGSDLILRKGTQVKIGTLAVRRGCFKVHRSKIMRQNRDSKNDIPEDAKALAMLVGLTTSDKIEEDKETALLMGLDRGIDYAWDKAPLVSEVPWFQSQVVWFWH